MLHSRRGRCNCLYFIESPKNLQWECPLRDAETYYTIIMENRVRWRLYGLPGTCPDSSAVLIVHPACKRYDRYGECRESCPEHGGQVPVEVHHRYGQCTQKQKSFHGSMFLWFVRTGVPMVALLPLRAVRYPYGEGVSQPRLSLYPAYGHLPYG